jgi:hypothetical protein
MSNYYSINVCREAEKDDFHKGTFLAIIYVNKIPPHLAIVSDNRIFEISVKGNKIGMPFEPFYKTITQKKIPSVFIKVKTTQVNLYESFEMFCALENGKTCLSPIKKYFSTYFDFDSTRVETIFDLLPLLEKFKMIETCISLNIGPLNDNNLLLQTYSLKDIFNRIEFLKK